MWDWPLVGEVGTGEVDLKKFPESLISWMHNPEFSALVTGEAFKCGGSGWGEIADKMGSVTVAATDEGALPPSSS